MGETFEVDDADLETLTVLQVVRFAPESTNWVWYRDYPLFASINHRGTTNGWNTGSEQLSAAYHQVGRRDQNPDTENNDHTDAKFRSGLISDDELETLCSEFLRQGLFEEFDDIEISPYERYVHTYPVGGSLQSVDIVARDLATDRVILSQVTFESEASEKVQDLVSTAGDQHTSSESIDAWFFGENADAAVNQVDSDIPVPIDIADVLQCFKQHSEQTVLDAILDVEADPEPPEILQNTGCW